MDFLRFLRDALRDGLARMPADYRERHARWLLEQQVAGGAFGNRRGIADLYYTAFALRSLSALNALSRETAVACAEFLHAERRVPERTLIRQPKGAFSDAVMMAAWWDSMNLCEEVAGELLGADDRAAAIDACTRRLTAMRRADGGYAKTDIEGHGSLYHTFLAGCAWAGMKLPFPEPERAAAFLRGTVLPEGGYLENKFSKKPGTNGCAAGVALSLMLDVEIAESHASFLRGMHSFEGGFQATPSAPIADLLSTFTGLFTLRLAGPLDPKIRRMALAYARSMEDADEGGYAGFALETVKDAEYTFYGLGVEAILQATE